MFSNQIKEIKVFECNVEEIENQIEIDFYVVLKKITPFATLDLTVIANYFHFSYREERKILSFSVQKKGKKLDWFYLILNVIVQKNPH